MAGLDEYLHHPGQQPLGAQLFGGALDIRGQGVLQAFEFGNLGYASALAMVLFLIILVLTLLIIRSSALWVYYEAEQK